MTEGYIKFNCIWERMDLLIPEELFLDLEKERFRLYELGLIGMNPEGIGFGNISVRSGDQKSFIITGSATGQYAKLRQAHYAMVTGYSFEANSISCRGLTKASAESLSHAAVYEAFPEIGAVVHIHCLWLWEKLLNEFPTTSAEIEYGTPEMAIAIKQLASGIKMDDEKVIVMGGHREGILGFGSNLKEATAQLINIYKRYKHD